MIGGVPHIDRDAEVRVHRERGGDRPPGADLLLAGRDGYGLRAEGTLRFFGGESPDDLIDHVATGFVVEATGDSDRSVQRFVAVGVHDGVADGDALPGLLLRGGADIDPHLVDFGDFFAVLRAHQVDGPFAGDAGDVAPLGHDAHAATGNHDRVVPTDGVEVKKALVVDMADEQSQLVHVTGEHQGRVISIADRGHPVA